MAILLWQTRPHYYSPQWFRARVLLYVGLSAYGVIPAVHWILMNGGLQSPIVQVTQLFSNSLDEHFMSAVDFGLVAKNSGFQCKIFATVSRASTTRYCNLLSDAGRRLLRSHSNDIQKLLIPRTHSKLRDRSFSAAGPRLWNDLPPGLRRPGLSFDSFRRSLKTHLFGNWSA